MRANKQERKIVIPVARSWIRQYSCSLVVSGHLTDSAFRVVAMETLHPPSSMIKGWNMHRHVSPDFPPALGNIVHTCILRKYKWAVIPIYECVMSMCVYADIWKFHPLSTSIRKHCGQRTKVANRCTAHCTNPRVCSMSGQMWPWVANGPFLELRKLLLILLLPQNHDEYLVQL